jgi:hypothetical protein
MMTALTHLPGFVTVVFRGMPTAFDHPTAWQDHKAFASFGT